MAGNDRVHHRDRAGDAVRVDSSARVIDDGAVAYHQVGGLSVRIDRDAAAVVGDDVVGALNLALPGV